MLKSNVGWSTKVNSYEQGKETAKKAVVLAETSLLFLKIIYYLFTSFAS